MVWGVECHTPGPRRTPGRRAPASTSALPAPEGPPARPPRVAMLTALFPPSVGGIQSHTLRLGQKLVERGVEVHVVTRRGPGLPVFERMAGVRVHRVGVSSATGAAGSLAFMAEALRAVVRLRGYVDVLHAHQLLSPSTVGLAAAALTGLPLIVNPHACGDIGDVRVLSATRLGRLRLAAVMRGADAFVAVSHAIRDELLGAGAPPQAVWSIVNGVDTDRFAPAAPRERLALRRSLSLGEEPLVVYAGRLAREKGVDVLIAAWPFLLARVPDARLCLLGNGPEEARLRQQARALGVEASVAFVGGVPDVAPRLRAADAAVLPSRTEGMPVALIEAMSCGLPVVATAVGGSVEVLRDGATGRLVAPDSPPSAGRGAGRGAPRPGGGCPRQGGARRRARALRHGPRRRPVPRALPDRGQPRRRRAAPAAGRGDRMPQPVSSAGRVGYLMSRYPAVTETFILHEMLELRRLGVDVEIFPLLGAGQDVKHPGSEHCRTASTTTAGCRRSSSSRSCTGSSAGRAPTSARGRAHWPETRPLSSSSPRRW